MRTHEFTFKKTQKKVVVHPAISIDLTVKEAEELAGSLVDVVGGPFNAIRPTCESLLDALQAFLAKNGVYVE